MSYFASKYCISDSFVDCYGYYISSKGFLPSVVDIMIIWVKFTHQSILVHWFLKYQCLLLPSPVWSLPICLDSWAWHSRILCNISLYSIEPCFHQQSHPQLGVVFALMPSLHSFWSYFSVLLQCHIGHLPTWGIHLSVSYLCLFILFMGFSRQECWFAIPFSSGPCFVKTLHHDPSFLGGPTWHGS